MSASNFRNIVFALLISILVPAAVFAQGAPARESGRGESGRDAGLAEYEREVIAVSRVAKRSSVMITAEARIAASPEILAGGETATTELKLSGVVIPGGANQDQNISFIVTVGSELASCENIRVKVPDGRAFRAETVGVDPATDLIVLKVAGIDLAEVEWGSSDALEVGSFLLVCGNPFGFEGTISTGSVTALRRPVVCGSTPLNAIQTDATINPGDTGAPVLNRLGQLVGIVASSFRRAPTPEELQDLLMEMSAPAESSRAAVSQSEERLREMIDDMNQAAGNQGGEANSDAGSEETPSLEGALRDFLRNFTNGVEQAAREQMRRQEAVRQSFVGAHGINFFLPSAVLQRISSDIISHGEVKRGVLGAEIVSAEIERDNWSESVLKIRSVIEGSAAQRNGLLRGDVLREVNYRKISRFADLYEALLLATPGTRLRFVLERDGETITKEFELDF
ncbi:MAG: trypsin-like peptidase domain-containing protein [Planctomycetes bacterium]|nr:trypsin-like peptidase domain-containing protein [Planctomycetota bacterium]